MLRIAQGLAFVVTLILAVSGPFAGPARALDDIRELLAERMLGKADAPVTIIEFASLGCPHCRAFHEKTLPRIKEKYIDTGKVKLIFRDFPLGQRALAAHMIARCAGPVRYFAMVSILFRDQTAWGQAPDGLAALQASARKGGMSPTQVDECLRSEEILQGIQKAAAAGNKDHGVDSTPFFIVAGEKVSGAQDFKVFEDIIERALKK
ncbi:MAG: disulfide bond formation protein DsbA [Rhodospirillales bacterium CG15_BIG_FIL_POST_REV_8_21_14_020_66_15]|nr:MAG: disulfide bond formation protein DsbA [Rhodospirillales bacterium CG15_BIG_FIL_POST_REV_8_21_14_020_66_15]